MGHRPVNMTYSTWQRLWIENEQDLRHAQAIGHRKWVATLTGRRESLNEIKVRMRGGRTVEVLS